jgi:hypothetical protein
MPRSRTSHKRNPHKVKIKTKPRSQKIAKPSVFDHSVLDYDPTKSQFSNYKKLGLLADANQIGAARNTITGFKPRVQGPMADPAPEGFEHPLRAEVPVGRKVIRQVPEGEQKVLRALIARHAEDYAAMARDMKVNTYQHTAAHLRKRIRKMLQEDAEEAALVEAAVAQGEPAPPPRIRKKLTNQPNRAFSKKSMNFN